MDRHLERIRVFTTEEYRGKVSATGATDTVQNTKRPTTVIKRRHATARQRR